ncbi:MAG: GNAT family N-acetyltransferase [Chitinophagaceae bacterium]
MTWILKYFDTLTPKELYAILRLRTEVFVIEQACIFQDMDNKDPDCFHLMGWQNDILQAYTRLVPPGVSYEEPSIGRVVTSKTARRTGIGKQLMAKSIEEINRLYGKSPIKLGAQCYLKSFYESFGFVPAGNVYEEDGIPHIEMVKP